MKEKNKQTRWISVAQFEAKCPKCDCHIHANDPQTLVNGAYEHFIDSHVVGGSFD